MVTNLTILYILTPIHSEKSFIAEGNSSINRFFSKIIMEPKLVEIYYYNTFFKTFLKITSNDLFSCRVSLYLNLIKSFK